MTNASCLSDIQSATGLAQGFGPLLGLGDQPSDLVGRRGDQGLGEPHALLGQLPHDVEGLVPLLGLEAVDGEDDLLDRFVLPAEQLGVLLTRGEHDLVTSDVLLDGVFRELDPVVVQEFGLDLGDRQWREHRRWPIQQKTSQPIAQLGRAMVISSSGLLVLACPGQGGSGQWLSLQINCTGPSRV